MRKLLALLCLVPALAFGQYRAPTYTPQTFNTGTNATVPVYGFLLPAGVGTNADTSVVPAGTGAFQLTIPDGTVLGGNKRGAGAVDLQGPSQRITSSQVASGQNAFAAGYGSTASGTRSTAVGYGTSAVGAYSTAIGSVTNASGSYALALGANSVASGGYSTALGDYSTTSAITGQVAFGFGSQAVGKLQRTFTQLFAATTSTTATRATADGTSAATTNQLTLRPNSAYRVRLYAVARDATNNADAKEWTLDVLIIKGATAASAAIIGTPTITSTFATAGASGWALAVSADTTNGALAVTVTSGTADAVDWNIQLDADEVM